MGDVGISSAEATANFVAVSRSMAMAAEEFARAVQSVMAAIPDTLAQKLKEFADELEARPAVPAVRPPAKVI